MEDRIHSFQSLGTLDGPGLRFVVFMQGCNLRCSCCHNPDTWDVKGGNLYTAEEVIKKVLRFKEYFGSKGGLTISGGEPLLQSKFCEELFKLAHDSGINTCLDTSGSILNNDVKSLLEHTDRVLLDIKYLDEEHYHNYVGCDMFKVINFLTYLKEKNIPTTVRQVIIPTKNDDNNNIIALKELLANYPNVDNVELLPFRKICQVKYDNMNLEFPFASISEPTKEKMDELNKLLKN
mgnify:CR=1 FL=1